VTSATVDSPNVHLEDPDLIGRRWRTGVRLLIFADASFVAALLFTYFYLRGLNPEHAWLHPGQATASIPVSWLLAGGLVLSAAVFRWAHRGIEAGAESRFVIGALLAVVVLLADAVGQVLQLTNFPFGVSDSAYSSSLYTLAGANLVHQLLTVFLGVAMWNRGRLHIYSASSNWQVRLVGLWWNWVALAAVLAAFTTSFIASPNVGG
jgi:heme/copper-type cytochrome/quinol oxidase subunit 3